MENWKDLIKPHILEHGLNYYEMGVVANVQKTDTGFCATVVGNENYEVEIEITEINLISWNGGALSMI